MVEIMSMVKKIGLDNVGKIFYSKRRMDDYSDLSLLENDLNAMNLMQWADYDRVVSLFVKHESLVCSGNQSELSNVVEPLSFVGNLESSEERISQENAFVGSNENQSSGLSKTYLQNVINDRETDESDVDDHSDESDYDVSDDEVLFDDVEVELDGLNVHIKFSVGEGKKKT
ncbi:tRNA-specific 2-thiouridylase MnmA [Striga asiatica]|uniref:tRNA-specific 2-thiouridylase MnmA n=1 Tax=Striga asiatica TaxID=4170 RepID=A0A5A7Q826_STRAF|nr:tRNA-specific 2-thiouridylase MnmA [Striga asiatica]